MTEKIAYQFIDIPKISDPRGNLAVIENGVLPFDVKRVYYLFDVPSGSRRGGHAHKELSQFLIALSGSFDVILKNDQSLETITLNNPSRGLLIPPGTWRELENFSSGAICLVIASDLYKEEDYIRNYEDFLNYKSDLRP